MKLLFLISSIPAFLLLSCAHVSAPLSPKTLTSDLFPQAITRSEYYRELAAGYALDEQTDKAIELFRLSLLHSPRNIKTKLQLSDAFRKVKMEHLAIAELSDVLKIEPTHTLALQKLGDLYLTTHIYSKARLAYNELLKQNSTDDKSLWALFFIDKIEKKYDDAFKRLNRIENLMAILPEEDRESWSRSDLKFHISNEKASLFRLQKNWTEEQKYLISTYELKPNFLNHVLLLSDSYFRFNKWTEAALVLQRFTETNDFNYEISERLASASVQLKNYEVVLREYAKQRPWSYDPYIIDLKTAHIYFLMKDYATAEKKYLALQSIRFNEEVIYYLSKIYQLSDRLQESASLLAQMPVMSDYYGEAQVELANFEKKNNDFNVAINRLRKAHGKRPDLAILYKSYADLLIENNRFVESIALLEQGIGFYPKDEELRFKLGFIHYRLNNQKSFKKQMAEVLKINPENAQIYAGLAELWYVKNKKALEVEFFVRKAMELKSNNRSLKPLLAWAMLEQNRSVEAIALFEEYYEQNPSEYFYVKSLAEIYSHGHVSTKADAFMKVALGLGTEANLKEKLMEKIQKKPALLDPSEQSQSRMPASLENF